MSTLSNNQFNQQMNKLKSNDVSIHHSINNNKNYLRVILNQLRVHQWVKNILIFVPILAAHSFVNLSVLINSVSAFLSFSLLASSVYIFNDIIDWHLTFLIFF